MSKYRITEDMSDSEISNIINKAIISASEIDDLKNIYSQIRQFKNEIRILSLIEDNIILKIVKNDYNGELYDLEYKKLDKKSPDYLIELFKLGEKYDIFPIDELKRRTIMVYGKQKGGVINQERDKKNLRIQDELRRYRISKL